MYKGILFIILISTMSFINQSRTKVVFFGDSITEMGVRERGYIYQIDSISKAEGKADHFEFAGAGIGGNKVYDLYLRMEKDVLSKNPDVVVIYVGVNDVWHKQIAGTGTDPDKFVKFYDAIIEKLKTKGIKAILCTPAVIGEKTDFSNQQDGDLNAYSSLIREIAAKHQLPLVNLRQLFLDYNLKNNPENKESGILTTDRVHLNYKGNQLVALEIWNVLKKY